ncbi:hypothetical protein [Arcicella rosea]|uniref:Uncharacterized protein n=1 Tax=Arcicella rosea TaxID=502909 RepID=A0A841EQ90_9BACT|nr:hypothetical protein [Arcicella rosea]MBB6005425.1 hypothetical protein [Arcicella rosea]
MRATNRKAIWISYDFGLKGDYTGLYTWKKNEKYNPNKVASMNEATLDEVQELLLQE